MWLFVHIITIADIYMLKYALCDTRGDPHSRNRSTIIHLRECFVNYEILVPRIDNHSPCHVSRMAELIYGVQYPRRCSVTVIR